MNDNTNQLYDLISNIQAKLNTENDTNTSNENISDTQNTNNTDNINNSNNDTTSGFDFSGIDINTILKMQGLFSKFNKNSPKKNLLYSLKPFLNEDRQSKLGEYITILSVMDALDLFGKKGSDKNV